MRSWSTSSKRLKAAGGMNKLIGSGVPDARICVRLGDDSKKTRVLPGAENVVFDDVFKFEVAGVDAGNIGTHSVEIEAIDTNTLLPRGQVIGRYASMAGFDH